MRPFDYARPTDIGGALALMSRPGTVPLGGGTNLVDLMKLGVARPSALVDITHLGLDAVEAMPDGGLRIGAGVRNSDLAADRLVRERFPVLSMALLSAASGQLRNMATVGGNLLQRTRCLAFMDPSKACNKREPGTGCSAIEGISRDLAVLGTSALCVATAPGDMAVALAALDAIVHFETVDGPGSLRVDAFYRLPGEHPERDTELPVGALITAVELPGLPFAAVSTYRKARDRASYAFALVSVAAALDVQDGVVRDVRLALGGVAHKPWRARAAEDVLRGAPATAEVFGRAADAELAAATPLADNAFKVPLARRLVLSTLSELAGRSA